MIDLRAWLKKTPKPVSVRIKTAGDEERVVTVGAGRTKWDSLEETVRSSGAVSLECLDKDGGIIRGMRLTEDEVDAEPGEDGSSRAISRAIRGERAELANVLDRQGHALERAFTAGANAASLSQEKLVDLVDTLTQHLTLAITNMHTLAANLGTIVQSNAEQVGKLQQALALANSEDGGSGGSDKLALILQMMTGGFQRPAPPAAPPPTTNGKGKHA